jgi:predicted transcriptional regulator of viral defense system
MGLLGPAISRPSAFRGSISFVSTIKANSNGLDVESTHSRAPRSRNATLTPRLRSVYPKAAICLLSALAFHEITTQNPASVWIALPKGARKPALDSPSLRIVRLSGLSLTKGIENHQVDGVPVRVYSAAKTVADCFKFRNKIGLDIAIESLKDCLRQKRASINEIYRYAKVCRVSNVIRPYMEAL